MHDTVSSESGAPTVDTSDQTSQVEKPRLAETTGASHAPERNGTPPATNGAAHPLVGNDADTQALLKSVDDSTVPNRDAFGLQMLPGEFVVCVTLDAQRTRSLALTNYRLVAATSEMLCIVPVRALEPALIERIGVVLRLTLKDGRFVQHELPSAAACDSWMALLAGATKPPGNLRLDLPACRYYAHALNQPGLQLGSVTMRLSWLDERGWPKPNALFHAEIDRLGFNCDLDSTWRVTNINEKYQACATYPPLHVVPSDVPDAVLISSADYRTHYRFPSIVWRSRRYGTVLLRASQPRVGMSLFANKYAPADQQLIKGILNAVHSDRRARNADASTNGDASRRQLLIVDCRDSLATSYNQFMNGGGTERVTDYDPLGAFEYGSLPNVTRVLNSFNKLRASCGIDTEWMRTLASLLTSANRVACALVEEQISVLVHCSDGWDRTPQVVALAKLLVDPHYRRLDGFVTLIEREFADYGHKFAERCGHDVVSRHSERAPIFIQFLDCVHQLLTQYPTEFQFSDTLLLKLAYHAHSCLFGTFLANSHKERDELFRSCTLSVWTLLTDDWKYLNAKYQPSDHILRADTDCLLLWRALYKNCIDRPHHSRHSQFVFGGRAHRAVGESTVKTTNRHSSYLNDCTPTLPRTLSEGQLLLSLSNSETSLPSPTLYLVRRRSPTTDGCARKQMLRATLSPLDGHSSLALLDDIASGLCDWLIDSDGLLLIVNRSDATRARKRIVKQQLCQVDLPFRIGSLCSDGLRLQADRQAAGPSISLEDVTTHCTAAGVGASFPTSTDCTTEMLTDSMTWDWEQLNANEASNNAAPTRVDSAETSEAVDSVGPNPASVCTNSSCDTDTALICTPIQRSVHTCRSLGRSFDSVCKLTSNDSCLVCNSGNVATSALDTKYTTLPQKHASMIAPISCRLQQAYSSHHMLACTINSAPMMLDAVANRPASAGRTAGRLVALVSAWACVQAAMRLTNLLAACTARTALRMVSRSLRGEC